MSAADAMYSLQMLTRVGPPRLERIVAGAVYLDSMLEKGLVDEEIEEAAALLHAYAVVVAAGVIGEERERVRQLAAHVSRFANPVKGASGGVANP